MRAMVSILVAMILSCVVACSEAPHPRTDVVLEAVAGLEEILDTPLNRGRRLYSRYCSVCHGSQGLGDGFNAFNLTPRPRNFTDSTFLARLDSAAVVETITHGGTAVGLSPSMPPWKRTLAGKDILLLSRYVLFLSKSSTP